MSHKERKEPKTGPLPEPKYSEDRPKWYPDQVPWPPHPDEQVPWPPSILPPGKGA